MKKVLCIGLVMALLCMLSACNFTTNFSDGLGLTTAQCTPEVEAMLQALTDGDVDSALEQMYPDKVDNCLDAVEEMQNYLNGRAVTQMTQQNVRVSTSNGSAGKIRQETAVFRVVLEDETIFYVSVAYLSNDNENGFVSFQIVLGVV